MVCVFKLARALGYQVFEVLGVVADLFRHSVEGDARFPDLVARRNWDADRIVLRLDARRRAGKCADATGHAFGYAEYGKRDEQQRGEQSQDLIDQDPVRRFGDP
ncbi:hypothetical protein D9M68_649670 [compost metagenome]